jgi:DnaJ-class molecular chaperone
VGTDAQSTDAETEPRPCSPCRGTGTLISNLGGTPSTISCPWCGGSGVFDPERDAQAAEGTPRTPDAGTPDGGDAGAG